MAKRRRRRKGRDRSRGGARQPGPSGAGASASSPSVAEEGRAPGAAEAAEGARDSAAAGGGREGWLVVGAAVLVAGLLYGAGVDHAFQFDDETKILDNPEFAQPSIFLRDFASGNYSERTTRFVANLTFALDYRLFGFEPWGWNLTNLLLHLLNVVLVAAFGWALIARIGGASRGAVALGAAIFALHPLNSEAANYCNARPNVLVTTFYLTTLLCLLRATSTPRPVGTTRALLWGTCGVSFVLALLSKELAVTLCLMAPMLLAWVWRGSDGRHGVAALRLGPALALLAVAGLVTVFATGAYREVLNVIFEQGAARTGHWASYRVLTVLGQSEVFLRYLGLALLPLPRWLLIDRRAMGHLYEHMYREAKLVDASVSVLALPVASFFVVAIVLVVLVRLRRRAPLWTLLGLWPFVTHAPTSLLPRGEVMVEYRTYLPMVGLCLLFGAVIERGVAALARRLGDESHRTLLAVLSLGLCALLAAGTWTRNQAWADQRSMWNDVLAKAPNNPRAFNSLGMLDLGDGNRESAMKNFREAVRRSPSYGVAHGNIGGMLAQDGRYAEALVHLRLATRYPPPNAEAHNNLANVLAAQGQLDEAIEEYQGALSIDPKMGEAIANQGRAYERRGDLDKALELYRRAIRIDPYFPGGYFRLGALLVQRGDSEQGIPLLERAIAMDPKNARAHMRLGMALFGRGDATGARSHLERALEINPALTQARSYLQAMGAR